MRMLKRMALMPLILGASACAPRWAGAQLLAPSLKLGTELRIVDSVGERQSATYLGSTERELQMLVACGSGCEQAAALRWAALREVDAHVSHGHSIARTALGGAIGASGAVAATLAISAMFKGNTCEWDSGSCPALGFAAAMPLLVATGGAIGATVGWRHQRFSWERVWPPIPPR